MKPEAQANYKAKVALTLGAMTVLFGIIVATFWYQDVRFSLPTPRPAGLMQIPVGQNVKSALPVSLRVAGENVSSASVASTREAENSAAKPLFVHFFQAVCPCSKFNLQHIAELTREHGSRVQFVAVVRGNEDDAKKTRRELQNNGIEMRCVADTNGKIAARLGVYATPQAVILDEKGKLLYRGNYNTSRYCTTTSTQFARIALESHLARKVVPKMPREATISYGCALPQAK